MTTRHIELQVSSDLVKARVAARDLVVDAGLGVMDQTRFATAVSELCRNALIHAGGGTCRLQVRARDDCFRLEAEVSDQGPGIADLALALSDGHSTVGSLGAGLPGCKRLADEFDIQSGPDGTTVFLALVRQRRHYL